MTLKQKTILLVEDDKFVSKAYCFFLKKAGYTVWYAENGDKALENVEKYKPDLILLDLIMPGRNGFEILEELKAKKTTAHIPVIIMSNLSQETDVAECKRLGAVDYLIKSNFFMKDIIEKIKTHIGE